jgi:hypothetical protein
VSQPKFIIEEVTDPVEVARFREQDTAHKRNSDWLQAHWADVLPQARGKYLAVAGQEAFIADTSQEAWAKAVSAHPDDKGAFVHYVLAREGPRMYASNGRVVAV